MKIIPRKNVEDFSLPLHIFHSFCIADAIGKDGEEFSVLVGLEEKYILQLKHFSLDETDVDLQNNTSDKRRFGEERYEDWYKKNRTPFCLIHKKTDSLAALVWFGPKHLSLGDANWQTVGWRSYIPFRGKGLMKVFVNFAMDIYKKSISNSSFWIILKRGNNGSFKLATALGFREDISLRDDFSIVMVK